jgi:hypothetical protein
VFTSSDNANGIPGGSAGHNEDDNLTSTREVGVNNPGSPPNPTDQSNIFREVIIPYWQNESCCSDWGLESTVILSQPTARPGNIYSPMWHASQTFSGDVIPSKYDRTDMVVIPPSSHIQWPTPALSALRLDYFNRCLPVRVGATCNGVTTGGRWFPQEGKSRINWMELKAAYLGLQALFNSQTSIPNHIFCRWAIPLPLHT